MAQHFSFFFSEIDTELICFYKEINQFVVPSLFIPTMLLSEVFICLYIYIILYRENIFEILNGFFHTFRLYVC